MFVVARAQKNERDGKQVGRKEKELAVKNEWGLEHISRIEAPPQQSQQSQQSLQTQNTMHAMSNEQHPSSINHITTAPVTNRISLFVITYIELYIYPQGYH